MYLLSESVPEGAIKYCQDNIYKFLSSYQYEYQVDTSNFKYANPFVLRNDESKVDMYYFPIINNGYIVATFRVVMEGDKYIGFLSEGLAKELNALSAKTSLESPAKIEVNNGNIIAKLDGEIEVLQEDPTGKSIKISKKSNSKNSIKIVNCLDTSKSEIKRIPIGKSPYKYLNTTIRETQGQTEWCAGYVTAYIVNYSKGISIGARNVIGYFYPSLPANQSISRSQVMEYAWSSQYLNTWYQGSPLSYSNVMEQININRPIYLGCSVSTGGNHALALRGYTPYNYSIWNPWYNYHETMDINSNVYVAGNGARLTWNVTIAGWY